MSGSDKIKAKKARKEIRKFKMELASDLKTAIKDLRWREKFRLAVKIVCNLAW